MFIMTLYTLDNVGDVLDVQLRFSNWPVNNNNNNVIIIIIIMYVELCEAAEDGRSSVLTVF